MQLIAVTDIFGKTKAFEQLLDNISPSYTSIEIVDPYDGKELEFKNEEEAYHYFQKKAGLEKYTQKLTQKFGGRAKNKVLLLGFSVGASAIWKLSRGQKAFPGIKGICFYSSQIRNFLDVNPAFLIEIYFSKSEPSYNVEEVIKRLSGKPFVKCHKTEYLHGFMNRKSDNFNQQGYNKYLEKIKMHTNEAF